MSNCVKHVMQTATATCCECDYAYCEDCIVYPFGAQRPGMCVSCAMAFAGVSSTKVVRRKEPRTSLADRRRRKRAPKLPEVALHPPSLDEHLPSLLPVWSDREAAAPTGR
jgi:hypothetical protein